MEEIKKFISSEKNLAEEFLSKIKIDNIVILCGGGHALYWYCRFFSDKNVRPSYIIDKNGSADEKKYGIPVVSYEFVKNNLALERCSFVVTAPKYREEISAEVRNQFGDVRIYSFEAEIYYSFIRDVGQYRKFLLEQYADFEKLYSLLEDRKSKDTLLAFIKGRVSGNQKYFTDVMEGDQYFPKSIIKLDKNEVIVEVGSNDGKTLMDILERTGGTYKKIYCFEPDRECIVSLEKIAAENTGNIQLIKKGAGSREHRLYFKSDSKFGASHVSDADDYDYLIDVTTMDREINDAVSYIKMDIEGMEMDCLLGARNIIARYTPKIAVCVYHNKEDILEIPKYIKSINSEYKFYLRHHNWGATETVLYAVV